MTHYDILEVPSTATPEFIKKQYRKLSLLTHPDRKGGSAEKFRLLTEAYETLSNESARRKYDLTHSVVAFATPTTTVPIPTSTVQIEITLEQAYTGCAMPFQVDGETAYAEIPPGIDTNEVLVISRPTGTVRARIVVHNQTQFVRHGLDLTYTQPITLKEALCGVSFEIQHFEGTTMRLSTKDTVLSPSYRKILPLKGMRRDKNCGSLTITFKIEFPVLTKLQIQSLEKIL
jgi:DnaJ-class molecular chaperone